MVVFGQGLCIRASWLYSGKNCCIRAKLDLFGKIGSNRENWLYLDKVVLFGQNDCVRVKWLYSDKSGCNREKYFYLGKNGLFGQSGSNRGKWLYSGKVVVFGKK